MVPNNLSFGGGPSATAIGIPVLLLTVVACLLICWLPRHKTFIPLFAAAILIPTDQVVMVGPLHVPTLRILILFGMVRILWTNLNSKSRIFAGGINWVDRAVIIFAVFTAIDGVLLWRESGEVIFQLGNLYTTLGVYILLRALIQNQDDVVRTLRALACVAAVVAAIMICEQLTGRNPYYSMLGGARALDYSTVLERGDHLRARGCFAHPILAGTFGGIMLPLFVGLWLRERKERRYAALGIAATVVIPFAASSSTALFGFLGGVLGLSLWPLRRHMRAIRWAIASVLISLHLVKKAPVWHLISRVDLGGGSSSYHRYQLINQCILHFSEWWLIGTKSYADWGWDMWDLSNQYVGTADTAGIVPLISFLAIIVFGFKYLGRARKAATADKKQEMFVWSFGASLFANVVAFFGIGYFDQTIVAWYALLAMIAAIAVSSHKAQRRRAMPESTCDMVTSTFEADQKHIEVAHLVNESHILMGCPNLRGNTLQ